LIYNNSNRNFIKGDIYFMFDELIEKEKQIQIEIPTC